MFNKMAVDVPSESRTNKTVVSLLDHLRHPAPSPHLMVFHELCLY